MPSSLGCCEEANTEMDQSPSCNYPTNLTGKQQTSTASKEHMKTPTTELLAPQENLSSFSSKQMLVSVASLATSLFQRISAMTNMHWLCRQDTAATRLSRSSQFGILCSTGTFILLLQQQQENSFLHRREKEMESPPKYRNNKFRQEITQYPSAILANPTASSSAGH